MKSIPNFSIRPGVCNIDNIPSVAGVYAIRDACTVFVYVGQTGNVKKRFYTHLWYKHAPLKVQQWIRTVDTALLSIAVFDLNACERMSSLTGKLALRFVESYLIYELAPSLNEKVFSQYMSDSYNRLSVSDKNNLTVDVYQRDRRQASSALRLGV